MNWITSNLIKKCGSRLPLNMFHTTGTYLSKVAEKPISLIICQLFENPFNTWVFHFGCGNEQHVLTRQWFIVNWIRHIHIVIWIAKSVSKQGLGKHVTTQTTIRETMMECINIWLHSNIKSNDEKLLNYTNEACINKRDERRNQGRKMGVEGVESRMFDI
jgi:hypothetical protein